MWDFIFNAPEFDDPVKTRQAKLLNTILLLAIGSNLLGNLFAILGDLSLFSREVNSIHLFLLSDLSVFALLRARRVELASLLISLVYGIGDFIVVLQFGGIFSPVMVVIPLTLIVSRLLLGRKQGFYFLILAELLLTLTYIAHYANWIPTPVTQLDPILFTGLIAIVLVFVWLLIDFATSTLDKALYNAQKAQQAAESANRAKSEMMSFVSHELKTPLTAILGFADLAKMVGGGDLPPRVAHSLELIKGNSVRMKQMIGDLTDVNQMETGQFSLDKSAVFMADVVKTVVTSSEPLFREKEQSLVVEVGEMPAFLADSNRLIQILLNLLSNASKYTQEGGNATLFAQLDGQTIHIKVTDNGIGIRNEDKAHMFSQFFRAKDQTIHLAEGTGLGLNLTKALVELHGGSITFDSEYKVGTTFHVMLPFMPA